MDKNCACFTCRLHEFLARELQSGTPASEVFQAMGWEVGRLTGSVLGASGRSEAIGIMQVAAQAAMDATAEMTGAGDTIGECVGHG
jgi:hypothetical protein